jgi:protein-tyrosine phosphatase
MDISQITPRLYISAWPRPGESVDLHALGIALVISMTVREPLSEFCTEPLALVHVPSIDFPLTPIPLAGLRRGVEAAIPILATGAGVLCHCREGRHRSVAMACCILIAQGCSAQGAMTLVRAKRAVADPQAFWIAPRIVAFERAWNAGWSAEVTVPPEARELECGRSPDLRSAG